MRRLAIALLLSGTGLVAPSVAVAQATPPDKTGTSEETTERDIVVTGTRLIVDGTNSPTPVTVLPTEEFLKLQPGTVTDAVNLLPAVQGVFNGTSARPGGAQRNGAGAYLTLRNMGNLRTLVLYDSQRLIPTINQNQADTDASIIPQMLLKRVDVVTGGVSAVYGSDAISGVINFITDRDFNGVKLQASRGISSKGDDPIWDAGVAAGTRFADDRGHIEVSYQYRNDSGIVSRQSSGRDFYERQTGAGGNGTTVPYFNFDQQRISNMTYGGLIVNAAANGNVRDLMFTSAGTLTPFVHGLIPTATGLVQATTLTAATGVPTNIEQGGSGAYNNFASLKAGSELHQAFGRFDFDLTDAVHFYAQVAYTNLHTFNNFQSPNLSGLRISYANPLLDTAFSTASLTAAGLTAAQITATQALRANPNNVFTFGRFIQREPRADQYTESWIAQTGFEGKIGDFRWTLGGSKAESKIRTTNQINIDNGRLFAALDAVRNTAGQTVCRASLTNTAYANCVPIDLFGEGRASQASLDYVFRQTNIYNRTRQDVLTASIAGAPFSTWAGPVNMALSGEYRRLSWDVASDATPNDLADCAGIGTGITGGLNCTQGRTLQWFFNTMGRLDPVAQSVKEGAFEIDVPLLRDVPMFQRLSVTGAVRFTDYTTSGGVTTWKAGADWQVYDDLRIRATVSRDVRAPNVFELFSPIQRNPGIAINNDPLLCTAGVVTPTGTPCTPNGTFVVNTQAANAALIPEKADTLTVGAVWKPSFLPGFSLSLDYYKIKVSDAINLLQGFSTPVLTLCAGASPPAFCATFVTRNASNAITGTFSTYLNIASFRTEGLDGEMGWKGKLFGNDLNLRVLASYQPKLTFDQGPAGVIEAAGFFNTGSNRVGASPKWKVTGLLTYDIGEQFTVSVLERWRSGMRANALTTLTFQNDRLPPVGYTNLNLSWHPKGEKVDMEFYVNVSNLFDTFPTVYYSGTSTGLNQGLPEGDDVLGRYFTVGAKLKF